MDKREGVRNKIFRPESFVSKCRKTSQGTLLCSASEVLWKREGVGASIFFVEFFLSHSAEKFPGRESLSVSFISGIENVWTRGSIRIFRRIFLSHGAKKFHFVRELFSVSQVSGIENNLHFRGLSHYFLSRFLLSQRVGKYHR